MKIVVVNSNPIHFPIEQDCISAFEAIIINNKEDLNFEKLQIIEPAFIFFLHWSYLIPEKIYNNFNCVVFHMTDLPYGRGGSPLQNLIVRGHKDTMVSAIKVGLGLDTGPVFLKMPLSLEGTGRDIFLRAGKVMFKMIEEIMRTKPNPIEQSGEVIVFKRRKPNESNLDSISDIETVYDYIRMLDAEGYPKAFIESDFLKFEFSEAIYGEDEIVAQVKIKIKK